MMIIARNLPKSPNKNKRQKEEENKITVLSVSAPPFFCFFRCLGKSLTSLKVKTKLAVTYFAYIRESLAAMFRSHDLFETDKKI